MLLSDHHFHSALLLASMKAVNELPSEVLNSIIDYFPSEKGMFNVSIICFLFFADRSMDTRASGP